MVTSDKRRSVILNEVFLQHAFRDLQTQPNCIFLNSIKGNTFCRYFSMQRSTFFFFQSELCCLESSGHNHISLGCTSLTTQRPLLVPVFQVQGSPLVQKTEFLSMLFCSMLDSILDNGFFVSARIPFR